MKSIMYRYFRHKQTYKYLDVLQDLVNNYNHRQHRSLGLFRHADGNRENANEVRYYACDAAKRGVVKKKKTKRPFKFKIGDLVRITYLRHPFQRDYQQKWTEELFKIRHRYIRQGILVYQLKDFSNEDIDVIFYQPEKT